MWDINQSEMGELRRKEKNSLKFEEKDRIRWKSWSLKFYWRNITNPVVVRVTILKCLPIHLIASSFSK